MTPLVSVVVPVYNGERFLAECLDALIEQDHRPLEIIVADDGSTDGTPRIARNYPADLVHYVRQDNAGPSAARNLGIDACRGELITFCDCDDLYHPGKVSAQVRYLSENPASACVMVRHRTVIEPGTEPPPWVEKDDGGVQVQSAMVRRSVVEAVGGYNPEYRMSENMEWLARIKSAGLQVDVLDEVLVDRRLHGTNASYDRKDLQHNLLASLRTRIQSNRSTGEAPQ